jgi:hypothetical protein
VAFRMPGIRRKLKMILLGTAALGAAAGLIPAAQASVTPDRGAVTPAAGVLKYNANVCGSQWVDVHINSNSYYNFYNAPSAQASTCLTVERYHLDFQITKATIHGAWGFPNISSGWEWGDYTCTGHKGVCFKYPVQEKKDGTPKTSVETWLAPGTYNAAYDIWFNKTDAHPGQDNGTEVMIWLAHPGIDESGHYVRYVTIEGIRFGVMAWIADHNDTSWHYVAYVMQSQRSSVKNLWLNPLFRNAIANGELSSDWWLTSIDFGFELVRGGVHNNVHYYSLTGVK